MEWLKDTLTIQSNGKGMYEITDRINKRIREWKVQEGMCFLHIPHVSASLTISEGYAGAAQIDVEEFYERLVPDGEKWYRHTSEGPDDSPSHIRFTLTQPGLSIPIDNGKLTLGTWQAIFIFEHRSSSRSRHVYIRCLKIA